MQVVRSANDWRTPPAQRQSIGQNTAVLDAVTGAIHLLFARNDSVIFSTSSSDHGATWRKPKLVLDRIAGCSAPAGEHCWLAPTFSAVQLRHQRGQYAHHNGDLVACFDYKLQRSSSPPRLPLRAGGTLLSSDSGASWFVGARDILSNECAIAELENGTVVLNARNNLDRGNKTAHRAIAWSHRLEP